MMKEYIICFTEMDPSVWTEILSVVNYIKEYSDQSVASTQNA